MSQPTENPDVALPTGAQLVNTPDGVVLSTDDLVDEPDPPYFPADADQEEEGG